MSMDYLLKCDEYKFVSPPVYLDCFLYVAKSNRLSDDTDSTKAIDIFKNTTNSSDESARKLLQSLDVSDIRAQSFNRHTDSGWNRNLLPSQQVLFKENSRRRNAQYKSIALRSVRYDNIDWKVLARKSPYLGHCEEMMIKMEEVDEEESIADPEAETYKELLINVSVYLGYVRELAYHEVRLGRLMKVTDRIELTGDQTLLDLKNSFLCPVDFSFCEDFSEKTPTQEDFAKNKYPSAMFFIDNTFYVESMTPNGKEDPSQHIREWAAKQNSIGSMHVALMSETKLGTLRCRLGQPYVFIHQGVCEHLLVFNDISLTDETHKHVKFPRRLVERNFRRIPCLVCKQASARKMVLEEENHFPSHPAYLCDTCYTEFCFDTDGNKNFPFKAVPYCDRKDVREDGSVALF